MQVKIIEMNVYWNEYILKWIHVEINTYWNEYILKWIYMQLNTHSNENFIFLIVQTLELYTRIVCEMFVKKHSETIKYIKN